MSSRVCLLSVQGNNLYPSPHIATLRRILAFSGCILRRLPVFVTFAFFPLSFHPAYYCNSQQVVILRRMLSLRKVLLSDLSPCCPCLDFLLQFHTGFFSSWPSIYIDVSIIIQFIFPVAFYAGYSTPFRITFRWIPTNYLYKDQIDHHIVATLRRIARKYLPLPCCCHFSQVAIARRISL